MKTTDTLEVLHPVDAHHPGAAPHSPTCPEMGDVLCCPKNPLPAGAAGCRGRLIDRHVIASSPVPAASWLAGKLHSEARISVKPCIHALAAPCWDDYGTGHDAKTLKIHYRGGSRLPNRWVSARMPRAGRLAISKTAHPRGAKVGRQLSLLTCSAGMFQALA